MTKKHFIEVARMIKELDERNEKIYLAQWFSDFFSKYNKLFNKEKFLKACGVDVLI